MDPSEEAVPTEKDTRFKFGLDCCEALAALTFGPVVAFGHMFGITRYDEAFDKLRDSYYSFFSGRYFASFLLLRGRKVKPRSSSRRDA